MNKLRAVIIILLILATGAIAFMVSQKRKMQDSMETEETQKQDDCAFGQGNMIQIEILNGTREAHDADIWIIQDNQENRKASTWGTASAGKLDTGNASGISVEESPDGRYLIRMIDAAGLYYEANGISLENGETLVIKDGSEEMTAVAEVLYDEGNIAGTYDMFVASL